MGRDVDLFIDIFFLSTYGNVLCAQNGAISGGTEIRAALMKPSVYVEKTNIKQIFLQAVIKLLFQR